MSPRGCLNSSRDSSLSDAEQFSSRSSPCLQGGMDISRIKLEGALNKIIHLQKKSKIKVVTSLKFSGSGFFGFKSS